MRESFVKSMAKKMEAHLHEEFKLWSFIVLCQNQSRMEGGKIEESNMKSKRTVTVGHISSISWSPFYAYYMSFRTLGSQKSNALNSAWIRVETKKLWPLEDNRTNLCKNFVVAKSACETTCKHTCATSQFKFHFHTMRITLINQPFLA